MGTLNRTANIVGLRGRETNESQGKVFMNEVRFNWI